VHAEKRDGGIARNIPAVHHFVNGIAVKNAPLRVRLLQRKVTETLSSLKNHKGRGKIYKRAHQT